VADKPNEQGVRVVLVKRFPLSFCKVMHVKLTDSTSVGKVSSYGKGYGSIQNNR
jgi:hypothetical protein